MSYAGFERTFSEVFSFMEMRGFDTKHYRASTGADLGTLVWGSYRGPDIKHKYRLNVQKRPSSRSWLTFIADVSTMHRASHSHYCMHETRTRQGQLERFLDWLTSKLVEIRQCAVLFWWPYLFFFASLNPRTGKIIGNMPCNGHCSLCQEGWGCAKSASLLLHVHLYQGPSPGEHGPPEWCDLLKVLTKDAMPVQTSQSRAMTALNKIYWEVCIQIPHGTK